MRTRATLSSIFASVAILIIGWQIGDAVTSGNGGSPKASGNPVGPSSSIAPSTSASPSTPTATAKPGTSPSGSFTGSSVSTQYGNVQVQIVVADGKITDVKALQLTNDGGRSVQISNYAAPILRSEVLKSQSAKVASVSGATYTTDGYLTSLQSAMTKAGL